MAADCGELVSSVDEVSFDPSLVQVVQGSCSIEPLEGRPDAPRSLTATVENGNELPAQASVEWTLVELPGSPKLTSAFAADIPAGGTAEVQTRVTPGVVVGIPDEFRSIVRARVRTDSVSVVGGSSPYQQPTIDDHVRAGSPPGTNGEHRPVTDGGARQAAAAVDGALARVCGGCRNRSRRLTAENRRLRETFSLLGG